MSNKKAYQPSTDVLVEILLLHKVDHLPLRSTQSSPFYPHKHPTGLGRADCPDNLIPGVLQLVTIVLQQRPDAIYVPPGPVLILKKSVRAEECTEHISVRIGRYPVNCNVADCVRVPQQCHHLLKVCKRASGPSTDCTGTTVERQLVIESKERLS